LTVSLEKEKKKKKENTFQVISKKRRDVQERGPTSPQASPGQGRAVEQRQGS